jgi:hypothetical protein
LIISTAAVHLASDATANATRLVHTTAVELANITAYGALWIVQFVLCDRILFRPGGQNPTAGRDPVAPMDGPVGEPYESAVRPLVDSARS